MTRDYKNEGRPRRTIDPITALGVLVIIAALSFLLTYLALILPGKLAAESGPPEEFLLAATAQSQRALTVVPTRTVSQTVTPGPDLTPTPPVENELDEENSGAVEGSASVANPFSGGMIYFDPTANPRGNWPLPDTVETSYWMSIPNISLEAPVIALAPREQDYDGQTLMRLPVPNSYSISWDLTSSTPGFAGNTIMTGHNNLYGGVFQNLQYMQPGWEIAIWSAYGVHSYYVTDVIYLPEDEQPVEERVQNAAYMAQTGGDVLTLITCWPNEQSTHRLIVIARP